MFSPVPDGGRPMDLTTVSRRYSRLAKRLGIDTSIRTCVTTMRPSWSMRTTSW